MMFHTVLLVVAGGALGLVVDAAEAFAGFAVASDGGALQAIASAAITPIRMHQA